MGQFANVHSPHRGDGQDAAAQMRATEHLDKTCLLDDNVDRPNAADVVDLATLLEELSIVNSKLGEERLQHITIHPILHDYLKANKGYVRATIERNKGWANEEADKHFMILQESADNVTLGTQRKFHEQMLSIGHDMDKLHNLSTDLEASGDAKFLDLCMSPGGFSGTILANSPNSQAYGVSLPVEKGGHPLCIEEQYTTRIHVDWMDITMLSSEMGITEISADHPEVSRFSTLRPYEGLEFGLVFCDGNVLRTHKRADYREAKEGIRLLTSQLVLAFQRIKKGGTLVCRFHKIERLETAALLYLFNKISKMSVFKPVSIHGARSSFYMIAKDIQTDSPKAAQAVEEWKRQWREATLDLQSGQRKIIPDHNDPDRIKMAKEIVENFGPRLVELAKPIWQIQTDALLNKPFNTGRSYRFENEKYNQKSSFSKPRGAADFRTKQNWRPRNQEPETVQPISSEKANHYVVPHLRRSSLLNKESNVSHDAESGDGPYGSPPRHLWGAKPHMTMAMDAPNWRSPTSKNMRSPSPAPDRPVLATNRVHAYGIGHPGGNLTSNANGRSWTTDHNRSAGGRLDGSQKESSETPSLHSASSSQSWRRKQDPESFDDE
ncbi:hypothetical protein PFICI_07965 [Pestalotiopsis fici W106-1]|uniref:Ribosomal RNA methyltransferase FtsJ domain-containing protein n=1 Tax=Pestalotiopsis fici (strain W106-1 / CGMCC3.15140) TaxID=1229662 RepID=W3X5G9_PESFW|nr:uncharacterized protein PFICI_07965 [Pestalotiopsis fici W106-1]ETS80436.1 hypothetical protein PFICI_07965 [Pestalotiopsis fici W106-1]